MTRTESSAVGEPATPLISIVDDDASVRDATSNLLQSVGLRTEGFASAEQFCGSGRAGDTACLILDLRLPGMSGLELQQQLAAAGSRIPIIFISAHCDEDAQARALRMGALGFLCKPFSQAVLFDHIRRALQFKSRWPLAAPARDGH